MKKRILLQSIIMILFLWGCGQEKVPQVYQEEVQSVATEDAHIDGVVSEGAVTRTEKLVVYVCGAVAVPGLYELEAGARVGHAIEMAGGMVETAMSEGINLAKVVVDGEQIRVPYEGETVAIQSEAEGSNTDGKVNLNTASREQLMTLPGIGQSKAESILKFREEYGAFKTEDEIMQIEGIKEGVYNKIKEYICVK